MKRNNNLASLWNAHAQKQKAQKVSSSTPNQLIIHDQQVGPEIPCEEEIHETQEMEDQEARPENPSDEEIHEEQETEEGIYDVDRLPHDPGKRIPIIQYSANEQDAVRRGYIAKGPCQPRTYNFPQRQIGGKRRFPVRWFDKYDWLEYSVEKDAAFCFVCYLFADTTNYVGGDAFVNSRFRKWNQPAKLDLHVGSITSTHNEALEKFTNFIRPRASIASTYIKHTTEEKVKYKARLTYSIGCLRFLLRQGLSCRGHDESDTSSNMGNFKELQKWLGEMFEDVRKVTGQNAPKNCQMTAHSIQTDIINCCAKETSKLIIEDLRDDYFSILADESSDVYQKEQLALCIRYVDKKGRVTERFLGIVHVQDTTSSTLKDAIVSLLMEHKLTLSKCRGQGYDGASNMKGEINGLKTKIMDESPSAYYIHCFAHQLQLTLVAVAKQNDDCVAFFDCITNILNVVGISCRKHHMLREAQAQEVLEALEQGEIETGQGLNQEMGLGRPGDTRWGTHYKTISRIIAMYPTLRKVLGKISKDKSQSERIKAQNCLTVIESFDFIFMAHLLLTIFGYTDELCKALQKRDQDIINAIELVEMTKFHLQVLREDNEWETFLKDVTSFCVKHRVKVPDMDGFYVPVGRPKRYFVKVKNLHRFHVEMFLSVIDMQLQELNSRFDNISCLLFYYCSAFLFFPFVIIYFLLTGAGLMKLIQSFLFAWLL